MKFLMAGGGTGGHVIPALAVAQELRSRGHLPVFFGTRHGYEARLVPPAGFPLEFIEVAGINRVGLMQKLRALWLLPVSAMRVWRWIARERPAAVFSMGGYVAGPVVIAAILRRVPIVAMEPNAVPGMTNRKIARWIRKALVNFEETARYFPAGVAEVTGVPVRQEFFDVADCEESGTFHLLVTGGSQGSRTLNHAGRDSWALFAGSGRKVRIVHQAGRGNADPLREAFEASRMEGAVVDFIQDMPAAFSEADLVVCRSGASTAAELAASGKPSILVPFPFAADDHQRHNAEAMQRAGAAALVPDSEMTGPRLFEEVSRLMSHPELLRQMSENARKLATPGAAKRAADVLERVAER